jgi:hypothetical protein
VERLDAEATAKAPEGVARRLLPPTAGAEPFLLEGRREAPNVRWFALLTLSSAIGLAVCVTGDALSRSTRSASQLPFWVGLLVILAPIVARLLSQTATRGERVSLVTLLGLALYLVKVVQSPFGLDLIDELAHAANTEAILRTHKLFSPNSILPVTAHYPGLESLDAVFASMTGLSPYGAGLVVVGVARVVIMLALYLLFERLSGSARIAGLATAIYTANSSFLLFDAQVSYESLALPMLVLILFAVAEWRRGPDRWSWSIAVVLVMLALVPTHHLTAYMLLILLLAICAAELAVRRWPRAVEPVDKRPIVAERGLRQDRKALIERYLDAEEAASGPPDASGSPVQRKGIKPVSPQQAVGREAVQPAPWAFLLIGLAATLAWLAFVAGSTVDYLRPVFTNAFLSTIHTISAEGGARKLFVGTHGYQATLLERAVGLGSFALIGLAVPFGLWVLRRRYASEPFVLVLGLVAAAFYALAALRLAPGAWETAERATEFLFLGLGFVLALTVTSFEQWSLRRQPWFRQGVIVALISVVFAGGVISGTQGNLRLSQPYRVKAEGRVIEPEGRQVARWAAANLPPGSRYAASDADARFLATYAGGYAITGNNFDVDGILHSSGLPGWERRNLARGDVRYVVVDRNSTSFAGLGFFFTRPPGTGPYELLPPEVASKFDHYGAARLYDSGAIKIYDLKGVAHAPRKP